MSGEVYRLSAADAASALGWWLQAGVDVAIAESPRNWLKPPVPAPPNVREPSAQAVSQALETLHLFRDWLGTAPALPLAGAGTTRVLPHGQESAPVMLVAEMPAREDAAEGRPIGGEAWQLGTNGVRTSVRVLCPPQLVGVLRQLALVLEVLLEDR